MLDVVEAQGFRKVACATTAPMHFQLLESDVLLERLELLLVELCRAALTVSSNSCLRQFAPDFPTLQASLVMYQFPFKSGGFSCSWWPRALERWGLLARRLRRACARLAREHGAIFRKGTTSSGVHMNRARRLRGACA